MGTRGKPVEDACAYGCERIALRFKYRALANVDVTETFDRQRCVRREPIATDLLRLHGLRTYRAVALITANDNQLDEVSK